LYELEVGSDLLIEIPDWLDNDVDDSHTTIISGDLPTFLK